MQKYLVIFVEGDNDELFFEKTLKEYLENKLNVTIRIHVFNGDEIKNSSARKKINKFIISMQAINAKQRGMHYDYIFFTDCGASPCKTARKKVIKGLIKDIDEAKIVIVKTEIESWYLAGLDEESSRKLKLPDNKQTDLLTKDYFIKKMHASFSSELFFRLKVLEKFNMVIAKQKNESFRYFFDKYNLN